MEMDKERRGSLLEIEGTVEFSKGIGPLQPKATTKARLRRLIRGNRSRIVSQHGNWRRKANCLHLQIINKILTKLFSDQKRGPEYCLGCQEV